MSGHDRKQLMSELSEVLEEAYELVESAPLCDRAEILREIAEGFDDAAGDIEREYSDAVAESLCKEMEG